MIRSIRHKGLKRFYEEDDPRGVMAERAMKLRDILTRLGQLLIRTCRGFACIRSRAFTVIFRFADHDAQDVDYIDYH